MVTCIKHASGFVYFSLFPAVEVKGCLTATTVQKNSRGKIICTVIFQMFTEIVII